LQQLDDVGGPVAFESTGVSDRPLLEELTTSFDLLLVKVQTPRATCVERVVTRAQHLNLANDPTAAAQFHDFWYREIEPSYCFAASVDGTNIDRSLGDTAPVNGRLTIWHMGPALGVTNWAVTFVAALITSPRAIRFHCFLAGRM